MAALHDNLERERLFQDLVANDVKLATPEIPVSSPEEHPASSPPVFANAESTAPSYENLTDYEFATIQVRDPPAAPTAPREPRLDDDIPVDTYESGLSARIAYLKLLFSDIKSVKAFQVKGGNATDPTDCLRHDVLRPDVTHPESIKFMDSISLLTGPPLESRLRVDSDS